MLISKKTSERAPRVDLESGTWLNIFYPSPSGDRKKMRKNPKKLRVLQTSAPGTQTEALRTKKHVTSRTVVTILILLPVRCCELLLRPPPPPCPCSQRRPPPESVSPERHGRRQSGAILQRTIATGQRGGRGGRLGHLLSGAWHGHTSQFYSVR